MPITFTALARSALSTVARGICLLGLVMPLSTHAQVSDTTPSIGAISYWGADAQLYDQLPSGSVAVVNPDSGVFVATGQTLVPVPELPVWRTITDSAQARGVHLLGYVPTGYFNHTCNRLDGCQTWARIEAQVAAYFTTLPGVSGIFFDEVAPAQWNCLAFAAEYQQLRAIVNRYRPGAPIAFNTGVADACVLGGLLAGETVVVFEGTGTAYASRAAAIRNVTAQARLRGIQTWHLVHTVPTSADLTATLTRARQALVDRVYVTDVGGNWQAGENTWGSVPAYWALQVRSLMPVAPGVNLGTLAPRIVNAASKLCLRGTGSRIDQQDCATTAAWALTAQVVANQPYYRLKYGTLCATQASITQPTVSWSLCSATATSQMWAIKILKANTGSGTLVRVEHRNSAQMLTVLSPSVGGMASVENPTGALRQQFYLR
jgi:hypothetical protein